jgi:hypothetical protein
MSWFTKLSQPIPSGRIAERKNRRLGEGNRPSSSKPHHYYRFLDHDQNPNYPAMEKWELHHLCKSAGSEQEFKSMDVREFCRREKQRRSDLWANKGCQQTPSIISHDVSVDGDRRS